MTALVALWLPILLATVFVFIASSIIHMAPLWHKNDYQAPANQDEIRAALRPLGIPPGDYMIPRPASHADYKTPEFQKKMEEGPVMMMTVMRKESFGMASPLIQWFVYCLVVSIFAAYIAGRALPPGSHYLQVFRFAGCTAFCGYALALVQMSIWYKRAWVYTIKAMIDGLIFALLTAGTFGWLWPR